MTAATMVGWLTVCQMSGFVSLYCIHKLTQAADSEMNCGIKPIMALFVLHTVDYS